MSEYEVYDNPLIRRYASRAMARLWSPQVKFSTWRRLWVALAEAERALGLNISEEQIEALRAQVDTIDFAAAEAYERRFRHDVMAHVHALGDAAPLARPIIHLGATSCYVTDNTDLILIRESLHLIRDQLVAAIDALAGFADRWKDLPCLGYTHFQPAQLVTVGKRATLWCQELILDLGEVERRLAELRFLGVKGTTGTQASFLALFDGDDAKVRGARPQGRRRVRLRADLRRLGPDLFPEGRFPGAGRPGGDRRECPSLRHGSAAAGPRARAGRAVRARADRLLGHGLQAKPHAGRAAVLAGPVHHGASRRGQPDGRHPVARADPRRQRGPAADPARRDSSPPMPSSASTATSCRGWWSIPRSSPGMWRSSCPSWPPRTCSWRPSRRAATARRCTNGSAFMHSQPRSG